MRRQRFVDREAEHDPRAGVRRAQRHRHGLVRHAADGDHAMARAFLERRERHAREARHLTLVGGRAHDDRAVEVEQRRDARADAARMVAQHGANRRLVAAADDGLLERVIGDEHVDGRQELVGAIVHVLVEQHAGEADRALGLCRRIAFDEVEHREQHDELRRDDERDGEQQDSVTKAELFHAVAILRRPAAGLCALGHGCALIVAHNIATPYLQRTLRMRTTVVMPAGLLVALAGAAHCSAATLEVSVVDGEGKPIANVAVYATSPGSPPLRRSGSRADRDMDQQARSVRAAHARRAGRHRGDVSEQRQREPSRLLVLADESRSSCRSTRATSIRRSCSTSPASSWWAATFTTACSATSASSTRRTSR